MGQVIWEMRIVHGVCTLVDDTKGRRLSRNKAEGQVQEVMHVWTSKTYHPICYTSE
jgi:hypothetical protein